MLLLLDLLLLLLPLLLMLLLWPLLLLLLWLLLLLLLLLSLLLLLLRQLLLVLLQLFWSLGIISSGAHIVGAGVIISVWSQRVGSGLVYGFVFRGIMSPSNVGLGSRLSYAGG